MRLWMIHLDSQIRSMTITVYLMITELLRNLHCNHGRSCVSPSLTKVFVFFVTLQELAYYSHEMSQTSIRRQVILRLTRRRSLPRPPPFVSRTSAAQRGRKLNAM